LEIELSHTDQIFVIAQNCISLHTKPAITLSMLFDFLLYISILRDRYFHTDRSNVKSVGMKSTCVHSILITMAKNMRNSQLGLNYSRKLFCVNNQPRYTKTYSSLPSKYCQIGNFWETA